MASPPARSTATPARSTRTWPSPPPSPPAADCGLGITAAARAFGLGFVPVAREPYDLVTTADTRADQLLDPLRDLLADRVFHRSVEALGGYSTEETGRRIR